MRRIYTLLSLLLLCATMVKAQTTVFSDDFSTNQSATYTTVTNTVLSGSSWTANLSGTDWGLRRNTTTSYLEISNDASATANVAGWGFANTPLSGFAAPYNATLSSNTGLVTWTFNMRTSRTSALAGFTSTTSYGLAFVISCTSNTPNNAGNGYAVVMGGGTNNNLGLIRFTGGLLGTKTTIIPFGGVTPGALTNYMSAKLTYNPASNSFSLSSRDDGTTAFADPSLNTPAFTSVGTATDATYTGTAMTYLGTYWQGSTTANQTGFFDNVKVTVAPPTLPTLTTTAASGITFNSASSGGNVTDPGTAAVTARGVVWATTTGPTVPSPNSTSNGTGSGTFTSSLTGLSASTLYYVRAYATNTAGTAYGNEVTFTTNPAPAQYYNVAGSDVSVTTSWGTNTDGTGTNPTNFTDNNQIFNLTNSGSTLGANTTISGTNSKLIIGTGAAAVSFTIPAAFTLTAPVDILNLGTLVIQNATMPTFNLIATGSTIDFDGVAAPAQNYHHLKLTSGANLATGTSGVAGTFTPGTTTTATAGSTINFNGIALQTMPAFTYDSVNVANTVGVKTPGTTATIGLNRGFTLNGVFEIAATDIVNLAPITTPSFIESATRTININGTLALKGINTPTVSGSFNLNSGGKYVVDAPVGNSAGFIPNSSATVVYNAGSTIEVLQGGPRIPAAVGGSVIWSSPTVGTFSFLNNATNTIGQDLTVTAGVINHGSGGTSRALTVGGNLTVTGGRYAVLGLSGSAGALQTLTVNGNVTVSGGELYGSEQTTAASNNGVINIKGNLTHTGGNLGGTQTVGTSVITFNGTAAQSISTTGLTNTGALTLTINNTAADVTLASGNANLGTNGTLTLTAGKLILGANNVTTSTISGGSATSYVVTNGAGALVKNIAAATGTHNLPVGTAANYRPASINFSVAPIAGTLAARAILGDPGTAGLPLTETNLPPAYQSIENVSPDYWEVNSTATGGTYDITVTGTGQTGLVDHTQTTLIKRADGASNWALEGTHVTTGGSSSAPIGSRTGLTTFSQFAFGGAPIVVLPVTILSFTGAANNGLVTLNWATAQETNLANYAIERSTDGVNFEKIGTVAARNSLTQSSYSFTTTQANGIAYYRLKINNVNGTNKLSRTVIINVTRKLKLDIYPNPVANDLFVNYKKASNNANLQVRNMQGALVSKQSVDANSTTTTLDISALSSGSYILIYQNGLEVEKQLFIKK